MRTRYFVSKFCFEIQKFSRQKKKLRHFYIFNHAIKPCPKTQRPVKINSGRFPLFIEQYLAKCGNYKLLLKMWLSPNTKSARNVPPKQLFHIAQFFKALFFLQNFCFFKIHKFKLSLLITVVTVTKNGLLQKMSKKCNFWVQQCFQPYFFSKIEQKRAKCNSPGVTTVTTN